MWFLTNMVNGVDTGASGNGIFVCLRSALWTGPWSVMPNSDLVAEFRKPNALQALSRL